MTALPTGTVTLLFTDIEGSTLLLRRLGERYGEVLSQQRAILRSCFARHDGHELGTEGDSFFVHTSSNDTVRNRELWTVTHIGDTGELTVTHFGGHGTVTLPADYVREHVRLGYAATEPGNQSDTVTISLTLATPATTGRGLYVAMTRSIGGFIADAREWG